MLLALIGLHIIPNCRLVLGFGFGNGDSLTVNTFNVWVRRCHTTSFTRAVDLFTLRVNQASSSFVSGLEAGFAF
jgi:hypothetical protein